MKKVTKIISVLLCVTLVALMFTGCDIKSVFNKEEKRVDEVKVKTDLKDAVFTFSYGELKGVLAADQLASLFEDYEELKDDITVDLSYNDITTRYGESGDTFDGLMALLSDEEKAQLTNNSNEVLAYFVKSMNSVKSEKPIVEYSEGFWTDKDTIEFTQNGEKSDGKIEQAAKYFEYFTTKGVGEYLDNEENGKKGITAAGDDLTNIVYLYGEDIACRLTPDNVKSVVSSLQYETTPVQKEVTNENGKTEKKDVKVVTGITRIVKITLKDDEASVKNAFSLRTKDKILEEMKKTSSYAEINDYNVSFDGCVITATFNAVTDNIITATYDKNMTVNTQFKGVGELQNIGTQDLKFNCTDRVDYKFGWAVEAK